MADNNKLVGSLIGFGACIALLQLSGCGRKPPAPAAAAAAAPPVAAAPDSWRGSLLDGSDTAALQGYLRAAPTFTAQRAVVDPDPRTIAFDRDTTIRAIRRVANDGSLVVLDAAAAQGRDIAPGRILWMWNLLIAKVVGAVVIGDRLYVRTEPAPLTEAFRNLELQIQVPVNLAAGFPAVAPRQRDANSPTAMRRPSAPGGLMHVALNVPDDAKPEEPKPEDAPAEDAEPEWQGHAFNGSARGFSFSVGYAQRPSGLQVDLEARYGKDAPDPNDPSKGFTGGGAASKAQQTQSRERRYAKDVLDDLLDQREDLDRIRNDELPNWDDLAKLDFNNKYPRKKQELDDLIAKAEAAVTSKPKSVAGKGVSKLFDIASENVDVRLRGIGEMRNYEALLHISIANNSLLGAELFANGFEVDSKLSFVGRLGHSGQQNIKVPVMELPVSWNVPVPIVGIPLLFHIGADFSLTVSLTGEHATIHVEAESKVGGNPGFKFSTAGSSYGEDLSGAGPNIKETEAMSPGVSAVVMGMQMPRLGVGVGVIGVSAIAYIDAVHVITTLNSASAAIGLAAVPCSRVTYDLVGHVGVQTQILPGLLGDGFVGKAVTEKLSPKKEIGHLQMKSIKPPIKICDVT